MLRISSRVNEDDRRFDIVGVIVPVISSTVSEGDDDDRLLKFSFPFGEEGDKPAEDDIIVVVGLNIKRKKEKREEGKEQ